MYNITFTGLPVFLFTVLDQNFTEQQLLSNLHLYGSTAGDARMSWSQFLKWNILGKFILTCEAGNIVHCSIVFCSSSLARNRDLLRDAFVVLLRM